MATDTLARGMAGSAIEESKQYTDEVISRLPKGVIYKGRVDYYNQLPTNPEFGWAYTVSYKGTSGTVVDGSEYVCVNVNPVEWEPLGSSKPVEGWAKEDLTEGVQESLEKADSALQPSALTPYRTSSDQDVIDSNKVDKVAGKGLSTNDYTTVEKEKLEGLSNYDDTSIKTRVSAIEGKEDGWDAKYDKPTNGIPKTDLASGVQSSLAKADSALQAYNIRYTVEEEE